MHLDHKIPWNTVACHFSLEKSSFEFYPHTDVYCRALPSQANDLAHFMRVLIATITEFSTTEKAKYPAATAKTPLPKSKKLFSDEVLAYPERKYELGPYQYGRWTGATNPLSAEHQDVDYWAEVATSNWNERENRPGYGEHDDLAEALKMLIILASLPSEGKSADEDKVTKRLGQDAFSAVLRLSRNPETPVHDLYRLGWGGDVFGFDLVVQTAFEIYLLINVVEAVKARERHAAAAAAVITNRANSSVRQEKPDISFLELRSFHLWADIALEYDGSQAQNLPHAAFWSTCGVTYPWASTARYQNTWNKNWRTGVHRYSGVCGPEHYQNVRDPLAPSDAEGADLQRNELKQYLKLCFGIMYRFDLWYREWRGDAETELMWKTMITDYMRSRWQCNVGEDDKGGKCFVPGRYSYR